jgi:protein-S-isoprenylcysteine O-methyltransferase Ste14
MKKITLLDRYVSAKFIIGVAVEFPILVIIGILGLIFGWLRFPLYPLPNIIGAILWVAGYVIHLGYAHKEFKRHRAQAHDHSISKDKNLVTSGIYSKIRHPGYLGLILIYFGFAFGFGIVWLLIPVVIFTVLTYLTAIKEEELLKEKFGNAYEDYMKHVPWRLIPKVI